MIKKSLKVSDILINVQTGSQGSGRRHFFVITSCFKEAAGGRPVINTDAKVKERRRFLTQLWDVSGLPGLQRHRCRQGHNG